MGRQSGVEKTGATPMTLCGPSRHVMCPLLVALALMLFFTTLWGWSRHREADRTRTETAITTRQVALRLESFMAIRLQTLRLMALLWSQEKINTLEGFKEYALDVENSVDGLLALNWIDTTGVIRWAVPETPNRAASDRSIASHPVDRAVMRAARAAHALRLTPPVELSQGGPAVAAYMPLTVHGSPDGFLNAVFRTKPLILACLPHGAGGSYTYAIQEGHARLYAEPAFSNQLRPEEAITSGFHVGDRFWSVTLMPVPAPALGLSRYIDEIILVAGCLLALILALVVRRNLIRRDALQVRTAELQATFRAYPDLQFRLATDGTILDYHAATGSDLYTQPKEFLGRRIQEILPGGIGSRFDTAFRELASGTPRVDLEYELPLEGRLRNFEARVLPLNEGQVIVIARDITARKQAQEHLEIFRFGVEQAALPVYWVRVDGRIVYANTAACHALGYSRQKLEDLSVQDIDPDFPKEVWQSHWKVMQQKGSMTFQSHHRRRDGVDFPVQITISLISHQDTEYVWAYAEDTSQRQQAETDRTRLERQLRQAQKLEAVGQLAGGIAHEFNNLLTVILGCTDLMLMGGTSGEEARTVHEQNLTQIQTAVLQASDLTRQLLAFSRKNVENPTVIDTPRVLADIEKMLRHLIREDVSVELRIEPNMEPIRAGSGRLEQVLVNLAVNASDAMPDGGHLNIDCSSVVLDESHVSLHSGAQAGRHVLIQVSDDGMGMDRDELEHIFEPFYTTKPVGKGTGLGMATVYAFVTQVGGHIIIESALGRGTTIQLYFPAAAPDELEARTGAKTLNKGRGETILVCEDETAVREVVCDVLRTAGYTVLSAASGAEALEKAGRHPWEVAALVTDVIMPEMSGPKLADAMRAQHPGLRVMFISGYPGDLIDPETIRRRGDLFLAKPFSPADLQASLRRIIDSTAPGVDNPTPPSMPEPDNLKDPSPPAS